MKKNRRRELVGISDRQPLMVPRAATLKPQDRAALGRCRPRQRSG
jgi:hypothetical protein